MNKQSHHVNGPLVNQDEGMRQSIVSNVVASVKGRECVCRVCDTPPCPRWVGTFRELPSMRLAFGTFGFAAAAGADLCATGAGLTWRCPVPETLNNTKHRKGSPKQILNNHKQT